MQNSTKFKFPYDTRNSEQVNGEYKEIVHKFSNSDATPMDRQINEVEKRSNLTG